MKCDRCKEETQGTFGILTKDEKGNITHKHYCGPCWKEEMKKAIYQLKLKITPPLPQVPIIGKDGVYFDGEKI